MLHQTSSADGAPAGGPTGSPASISSGDPAGLPASTLAGGRAQATAPADRPLPFLRQLAYGLGGFGSNYSWTFVASFVMFYLTTVVGLSAAVLGTLMLVARFLDGITDIMIGGLIDRTHSRMGKARPWLFWSTFPLAISQVMLFCVPSGLPENGKYAWVFVSYLLLGAFFYTASNISYNTLVSLATRHQQSRVSMGSIRFICALSAGLVLNSTTPALVQALGGGAAAWSVLAGIYSLIFVVFTLITVFGVRELVTEEEREAAQSASPRTSTPPSEVSSAIPTTEADTSNAQAAAATTPVLASLGLLVRNRYFIIMLALFLVTYVASGLAQTAGIYFATYVLGNANLLGPISLASMVPTVAVLALTPQLNKRYSMRAVCLAGSCVSLVGAAVAYAFSTNLTLLLIGLALSAMGSAPLIGTMYAFVAATAEYALLRFSVKMEGVVYSCCSVGLKLGTGLGTAALGWLLAAGGFVNGATTQSESALTAISTSYLLVPLLLAALRIPLLWALDVEKTNERLRSEQTQAPATIPSAH